MFGVGYICLGAAPTLWLAMLSVTIAHLGGGAQWMLSSYGLQRLVPDHIRGRIFSFDYALITLSLGISSILTALLADAAGPRTAAVVAGSIAVGWAGLWWLLTRNVRRRPLFAGVGEPPATAAPITMAVE